MKKSKIHFNQALERSIKVKYREGEARSWFYLGLLEHKLCNFTKSNLLFKKSLQMFQETNNNDWKIKVLRALGNLHRSTRNFELAGEFYSQAAALSKTIDNQYELAKVLFEIGNFLLNKKIIVLHNNSMMKH